MKRCIFLALMFSIWSVCSFAQDQAVPFHPQTIANQGREESPVSAPTNGAGNFLGAEFIGNVTEPGKLKITLRVFYTVAQSIVPETEAVNVISGGQTKTGKDIALKKESEYIDAKYPVVAGSKDKMPPAIKIITYTSTIDLGASHAANDIVWMHSGMPPIINNVEINSGDAISLLVHIEDGQKVINNTPPMLDHLPAFKVSSTTRTESQVNAKDNDALDKVDLMLSLPMIYHASAKNVEQEKGVVVKKGKLTDAKYRKGFSADKPFAESLTYNKESNEFIFEHPSFGNYLCAVTISDYRNKELLSHHQAIFIIASIL